MTARLKDKTAIVIGSARGIGAGIAEVFAEEGAKVVIADALEAEGKATAARLAAQTETMPFAMDVSSPADNKALVEATLARFGRVDILVQNAGIYPLTMIADTGRWTMCWPSTSRACSSPSRPA
jgi:3-oxoacyl-[acyl-carrier protein] reductase